MRPLPALESKASKGWLCFLQLLLRFGSSGSYSQHIHTQHLKVLGLWQPPPGYKREAKSPWVAGPTISVVPTVLDCLILSLASISASHISGLPSNCPAQPNALLPFARTTSSTSSRACKSLVLFAEGVGTPFVELHRVQRWQAAVLGIFLFRHSH